MLRLLFEKKGKAVWISHLDLMRVFQRAFKRAGLPLTHTQGFNPRPSVSIALPLSVGVYSQCELLDFSLDQEAVSCEQIRDALNRTLIEGVHVLKVYENGQKLKNLCYLSCTLTLNYDTPSPTDTSETLQQLLRQDSIVVSKKSKQGVADVDIRPMILSAEVRKVQESIQIQALICCQNPSLNPALILSAIEKYAPDCAPAQARICRNEIYNANHEIFR